MKKLMQIIEASWKELILVTLMAVMGYELVQVRVELDSLQNRTGSLGGRVHHSNSARDTQAPDMESFKSDLRSLKMRLTSLETSMRSLKSKMSSVESELNSLDRKTRY